MNLIWQGIKQMQMLNSNGFWKLADFVSINITLLLQKCRGIWNMSHWISCLDGQSNFSCSFSCGICWRTHVIFFFYYFFYASESLITSLKEGVQRMHNQTPNNIQCWVLWLISVVWIDCWFYLTWKHHSVAELISSAFF